MLEKLKGSQFRFINEKLYSCSSQEAQEWFGSDKNLCAAYHEGYRIQVSKWPIDPLDLIITDIKKMPRFYKIADMGCGEARLSQSVKQKVHSFDFCQLNDRITPCDICHVPLADESMDIVIFCLSLMGTNITDLIMEGHRILKKNGLLKIMEIISRFESDDEFVMAVEGAGFQLNQKVSTFIWLFNVRGSVLCFIYLLYAFFATRSFSISMLVVE
ncbi:unnamed protein product [Soboliphyme baturini]|uniref:Ribosomal RNA-processing protein 8 n=1 Tax=Soboliphyme baturini TaxID=241478 RepID=A0A183J2H9_9BILA|nr:unnamed protein product [Soboliphyme baturini]